MAKGYVGLIILGLLVVIGLWVLGIYNGLVGLRLQNNGKVTAWRRHHREFNPTPSSASAKYARATLCR